MWWLAVALVAYFDESGDHSLGPIDPSAPNFCLALTLFDSETCVNTVVPAVTRFKFAHFGHEAVVLHSADIRKSRRAFVFLNNATLRGPFIRELSELMAMPHYEIIAIVIRKDRLVARYKAASSPYDLSMVFALERLLDWAKQRNENDVHVVANREAGKKVPISRPAFAE